MPIFQADPSNFVHLLQMVRGGDEISLAPGEYKGAFTIKRGITIRGTGANTVIFAIDEPALVIEVPGVRLENLALERTVGGDTGEDVLLATPGTLPVLQQVSLRGVAQNVQWQGVSWDIPAVLDFGEVETNCQVQRSWQLQLGASCKIVSAPDWLRVQTSHLSPGSRHLDLVLNSKDIPAGTVLSGSIWLEVQDGKREMAIAAKIKAPESTNVQAIYESSIIPATSADSEDWGYRFVGSAIDKFIRDVEGSDALRANPEFRDRRNHAEDLMFNLAGNEPRLFYLRRKGAGQEPGEEKWELTIATDLNDVQLPPILKEHGKTLSLVAAVSQDGYGGLRLLSARLVALARGQADGCTVPYSLRLLPEHRCHIGVPRAVLTGIATVPVCDEHLPTEDQLEVWQKFLEIEERIAHSRQFCVPFIRHNYGSATRRITFEIDAASATLDGSTENSLDSEEFWQRAARAKNEDVKLLESASNGKEGRDRRSLGLIEYVAPERSLIRIDLESDVSESIAGGYYQLPAAGYLFFEATGDISQIKRKKEALNHLQWGRTQNPYLADFFFDAAKARSPQRHIQLQQQDGSSGVVVISEANQKSKLIVWCESCQSSQSHKLVVLST